MSVAVHPPLHDVIHTMASPSSMQAASAATASTSTDARAHDTDEFDKASELPPMPVPYEGT